MFLLKGQTANVTSDWQAVGKLFDFNRRATIIADGVFDGATITVRVRPLGSTRDGATADDITFTATGVAEFNLSPSMEVRAIVTSAGASTNVDLWIG